MGSQEYLSKVPAITLSFWVIKIAATTLGETGGDTVTMTMNLGYLVGTAIFFSLLVLFVVLQILVACILILPQRAGSKAAGAA